MVTGAGMALICEVTLPRSVSPSALRRTVFGRSISAMSKGRLKPARERAFISLGKFALEPRHNVLRSRLIHSPLEEHVPLCQAVQPLLSGSRDTKPYKMFSKLDRAMYLSKSTQDQTRNAKLPVDIPTNTMRLRFQPLGSPSQAFRHARLITPRLPT